MDKILDNLKAVRKSKNYTQKQLAEKLGIQQASYQLIESGERGLDFERLQQIAIVLEVELIDIITWPDKYIRQQGNTVYEQNAIYMKKQLPKTFDEAICELEKLLVENMNLKEKLKDREELLHMFKSGQIIIKNK